MITVNVSKKTPHDCDFAEKVWNTRVSENM